MVVLPFLLPREGRDVGSMHGVGSRGVCVCVCVCGKMRHGQVR